MLAPQSNASRTILDFSGVWDFRLKPDAPWQSIAVPASYNDQSADPEFRRHVGLAWYRRSITVPSMLNGQRLMLRFDAVHPEMDGDRFPVAEKRGIDRSAVRGGNELRGGQPLQSLFRRERG